ncbi:hypothetical protein [Halobacteriovorax sp. ZH2_bin.1]|uniref:hypothetical protein n=1 Tax=unclassified Halobacteriovorax TaxID=2639665 RepID=UPI00370FB615
MKNNDANLKKSTISQKLDVVDNFLKKDNLADADRLNAELMALDLKEVLEGNEAGGV